MERLLEKDLLSWKNRQSRKPILLDGARQVGKSYLIENCFGKRYFTRVHKLDFRASPAAHDIFADSLEPANILSNIELFLSTDITLSSDLILFDEIGECQRAVDSLKYFSEQRPDSYLCATGSNIGLLESFPVGKVQTLELFPLSFKEFLMASGDAKLLEKFCQMSRLKIVHEKLWRYLLDYYYVGGMPEAVASWFENADDGINSRTSAIAQIHRDLITGYERDFGKYSGKSSAMEIDRVFHNAPLQLSRSMDDSVKRFVFKNVIEKKNRYLQLKGPIDWLEKSRLISKCFPIESQPVAPLKSLTRENIFKVYFFDIGLLGHMLEIDYREQISQRMISKGYIAENFVQNELRSTGIYPTYSWNERNSEIEFVYKTQRGEIIPVEVKSGKRTRAKSLRVYKEKYQPARTVKLIGAAGGTGEKDLVWPLYYTCFLTTL